MAAPTTIAVGRGAAGGMAQNGFSAVVCLRRGFIDLDDAPPQLGGAPAAAARATSSPPSLSERRGEASSVFRGDIEYVADLSARLNSLWGAMSPPTAGGNGATRDTADHMQARQFARKGVACSAVDDHRQGALSATTAGAGEDATSSRDSHREMEAEQPTTPWAGGAQKASIGHPNLCERPCIYFASGNCANGAACSFCHLSHSRKPGHLAKKHREKLQDLPCFVATDLVLSVLHKKICAMDASEDTMLAFDRLARCSQARAAALQAGPPARGPRPDRALQEAIASLTLRFAIVTLQRSASRNDVATDIAAEDLLQYLRADALHTSTSSSSSYPKPSCSIVSL